MVNAMMLGRKAFSPTPASCTSNISILRNLEERKVGRKRRRRMKRNVKNKQWRREECKNWILSYEFTHFSTTLFPTLSSCSIVSSRCCLQKKNNPVSVCMCVCACVRVWMCTSECVCVCVCVCMSHLVSSVMKVCVILSTSTGLISHKRPSNSVRKKPIKSSNTSDKYMYMKVAQCDHDKMAHTHTHTNIHANLSTCTVVTIVQIISQRKYEAQLAFEVDNGQWWKVGVVYSLWNEKLYMDMNLGNTLTKAPYS